MHVEQHRFKVCQIYAKVGQNIVNERELLIPSIYVCTLQQCERNIIFNR